MVFGGLPGTGKSTLSRALAEQLKATYLRIDVIEQTLRNEGLSNITGEGYAVAAQLAAANLALGSTVVADSVNPIGITRELYRSVGQSAGVPVLEIEVICSDTAEHQHRVETRESSVEGLVLPRWEQVLARDYEPWDRQRIVIDTAGQTPAQSLSELRARIVAGA